MSRVVEGLIWARRAASPIFPAAKGRKGAKAAGIRYERSIAKHLGVAEHGIWWEFCDANGPGACQTDFVLLGRMYCLVLEAKYTYTEAAWGQLFDLYRPVVEAATGKQFLGVQICKVLKPGAKNIVHSMAEASWMAQIGYRPTLHWPGLGPL